MHSRESQAAIHAAARLGTFAIFLLHLSNTDAADSEPLGISCPSDWIEFRQTCYKFVRAPRLSWDMASKHCRDLNTVLASVETPREHAFITSWLRRNDPALEVWYTAGHDQSGQNSWRWTTSDMFTNTISNADPAWLPSRRDIFEGIYVVDSRPENAERDRYFETGTYLAYNYSTERALWGWNAVPGESRRPFLCEVSLFEVPDIFIRQRKSDYGFVQQDPRFVPHGPILVQEPTDTYFETGSTNEQFVSVRCRASAYPPPDYSWFRVEFDGEEEVSYLMDPLNDERITQTDGTLSIIRPTPEKDRGVYKCVASNQYGSVASRHVRLTFGYIHHFPTKRDPMTVTLFAGAAIPCDPPPHFPEVSYIWSRDGFPNFVEESKRVLISRDGQMYISTVEVADEGGYQCIVKSSISELGKTGPIFNLRVIRDLSFGQLRIFTGFPKIFPSSPVAGNNVSIECVASGYPVPSYNWTRGRGEAFPEGTQFLKHGRVLFIPNVQVGDSGDYHCTAFVPTGTTTAKVNVNVNSQPRFLLPLEDQYADSGSDVEFLCEAYGSPAVQYRWLRNGEELNVQTIGSSQDSNRIVIGNSDGGSSEFRAITQTEAVTPNYFDERAREQALQLIPSANVLRIRNVRDTDSGMYQCEASNVLGTASSTAELRLMAFEPNFAKRPVQPLTYAANGGNVTLTCAPEAAPRPQIQWFRNGQAIGGASGRLAVLPSGDLLISPVNTGDNGVYSCRASNSLGRAESNGMLRVMAGPKIRHPPRAQRVQVNRTVVLGCEAVADPRLDMIYRWTLNGLPIDPDTDPRYEIPLANLRRSGQSRPGPWSGYGYLAIINATYGEAGDYQCIAQTTVGEDRATAAIRVMGQPGPPSGVKAFSLDGNPFSATLQWTDGRIEEYGLPIRFYRVEGWTHRQRKWFTIVEYVGASRNLPMSRREYDIIDLLSPWNNYRFRLSAANTLGYGPPSDPSPSIDVPPAKPRHVPEDIGGGGGKVGDLSIRWTPLGPEQQNAPGIGYRVHFRRKDSEIDFRRYEVVGDVGHASVHIGDTEYYKPYEVRIQAFNERGDGPISEIVVVYTAENTPLVAPINVRGDPFNATAVNISWTAMEDTPDQMRGRLRGHRIKYWRRSEPQSEALVLLKIGTDPWTLLVGLTNFTEYWVSVMAYNLAGNGPESEPVVARTFRSQPIEPPTGVVVLVLDWDEVEVEWRGIRTTQWEEGLLGYKLRYWRDGEEFYNATDVVLPFKGQREQRYRLYDLKPGETYNLRVLGYSRGGDGRMSSPVWTFVMNPYGVVDRYSSFSSATSVLPVSNYLWFAQVLSVVLYTVVFV